MFHNFATRGVGLQVESQNIHDGWQVVRSKQCIAKIHKTINCIVPGKDISGQVETDATTQL